MIRRSSKFLEWLLVDTHLWVSAAAACLAFFVASVVAPPVRLVSAAIVFSATLLIYAVDDIFDGRMATQPLRWLTVIAAAIGLSGQLLLAPPPTAMVVGFGALPALGYAAPIAGRRLRELPGVKPFFVALSLTTAVVAVPALLAWEGRLAPVGDTLTLAVLLFPLILSNVCFFDLRDRNMDAARGIQTIPVRLGEMATRTLCLALCLFVGVAALALGHAAGGRRLAYALAVDGVPVLLGMTALLQSG